MILYCINLISYLKKALIVNKFLMTPYSVYFFYYVKTFKKVKHLIISP